MVMNARLATASAAAWAYLLVGHGRFWLTSTRLPVAPPNPSRWPSVAALVPARDEAAVLGQTLPTLLAQDYPGELTVWLVDDGSGDGTGALARRLAGWPGAAASLTVLAAAPPPPGGPASSTPCSTRWLRPVPPEWSCSCSPMPTSLIIGPQYVGWSPRHWPRTAISCH